VAAIESKQRTTMKNQSAPQNFDKYLDLRGNRNRGVDNQNDDLSPNVIFASHKSFTKSNGAMRLESQQSLRGQISVGPSQVDA